MLDACLQLCMMWLMFHVPTLLQTAWHSMLPHVC
jgi:hypothetical protein